MVSAEEISRGERFVCVLFESGEWPRSALDHFKIDEQGFSNFITNQVGTLRQLYHDIDPRHEAAIATMFTHVFLSGFAAARGQGYSADEGVSL